MSNSPGPLYYEPMLEDVTDKDVTEWETEVFDLHGKHTDFAFDFDKLTWKCGECETEGALDEGWYAEKLESATIDAENRAFDAWDEGRA